ncbi:MAG TPA: hypothetical protein VD971_00490 [Phycisphaerales bacterium]|nr:hypothetical protein [Phycisphaerales bacterium]
MRSLFALAALAAAASASSADLIPVQSYEYTAYAPYGYLDSGNELTDGVWSTTGINPVEPWVGFSSAHTMITFDLGAGAPAVAGSSIVYCLWTGAAVYLPESVRFRFSNDASFAAYTEETYLSPFNGQPGAATVTIDYNFSAAASTRYVRVLADSQFEWLFLGEVQFHGVPTPGSAALAAVAVAIGLRRRKRA